MPDKPHNNKPRKLAGGITQAQLDGWKKKYDGLHKIEVEISESEKLTCYLREPSRDQYGTCAMIAQKKTALAGGEYILNDCWLGGDERIKTEDKVYISAALSAMELFDFLPSSISKL